MPGNVEERRTGVIIVGLVSDRKKEGGQETKKGGNEGDEERRDETHLPGSSSRSSLASSSSRNQQIDSEGKVGRVESLLDVSNLPSKVVGSLEKRRRERKEMSISTGLRELASPLRSLTRQGSRA